MDALFAAMQSDATFRAVTSKIRIGSQRDGAAKAARSNDVLYESRKFGPGNIEWRPGALRLRTVTPKGTVAAPF